MIIDEVLGLIIEDKTSEVISFIERVISLHKKY